MSIYDFNEVDRAVYIEHVKSLTVSQFSRTASPDEINQFIGKLDRALRERNADVLFSLCLGPADGFTGITDQSRKRICQNAIRAMLAGCSDTQFHSVRSVAQDWFKRPENKEYKLLLKKFMSKIRQKAINLKRECVRIHGEPKDPLKVFSDCRFDVDRCTFIINLWSTVELPTKTLVRAMYEATIGSANGFDSWWLATHEARKGLRDRRHQKSKSIRTKFMLDLANTVEQSSSVDPSFSLELPDLNLSFLD